MPASFFHTLKQRRLWILLVLGFSAGLPLALTGAALQAWLTVEGLDLTTIGLLTLVGIPYTCKFIWAPLMDRFEPPGLGRRRSWLVLTQMAIAGVCFAMATLSPQHDIIFLGVSAVLLAWLSASQDIVVDAYRIDILHPEERGLGAGLAVMGYRVAMLVSGGLAFILADQYLGWPDTYRLMGVIMACLALCTVLFAPRSHAPRLRSASLRELVGFVAMVSVGALVYGVVTQMFSALLPTPTAGSWRHLANTTLAVSLALLAGGVAAYRVGFPSLQAPWQDFFSRRAALQFLLLILLYKLGDAFAGSLTTTFLIRGLGFTQTEVGSVNKLVGLLASIVGVLLGGGLMVRWGLFRSLWVFGWLQALSNFAYWVLAVSNKSVFLMGSAVAIENLAGGMGTAAFVAFLMALCNLKFSATQYALLSALAAVGRVYVGPASGVLVTTLGWDTFFLLTVLIALPGLALLWVMRHAVRALETTENLVEAGE